MNRNLASLVLLLAIELAEVAHAEAPMCVVTGSGYRSCLYYDAASCQQAARSMNGICTGNTPPAPAVPPPPPNYQYVSPMDIGQAAQQGYDEGVRRRQEQDKHDAEMRLLQAQTEAAQRQAAASQQQPAMVNQEPPPSNLECREVVYRCAGAHGDTYLTNEAFVGCVVVDVRKRL